MKVRILFFARLRELAGCEAMEMELPEGSTIGDLWHDLQQRLDALAGFRTPPLMALDEQYAGVDTELTEGSEIALFPPVSGG